jgi:hypothetical protein
MQVRNSALDVKLGVLYDSGLRMEGHSGSYSLPLDNMGP